MFFGRIICNIAHFFHLFESFENDPNLFTFTIYGKYILVVKLKKLLERDMEQNKSHDLLSFHKFISVYFLLIKSNKGIRNK